MSFLNSQTSSIFTGISGIVSGIGSLISAGEEEDIGKINAQVFEQKARAERESQKLLEVQKRKIIKSQIGTQVAQTGASGFKFTGDPITIMTESLANAEFDILVDRYNSEVRARGFETDARISEFEGKQRKRLRTAEASRTFLSTAADILVSQQSLGGRGENLGGGTTSRGIKVPSRFVPPR